MIKFKAIIGFGLGYFFLYHISEVNSLTIQIDRMYLKLYKLDTMHIYTGVIFFLTIA